jgi:hypothetical protein
LEDVACTILLSLELAEVALYESGFSNAVKALENAENLLLIVPRSLMTSFWVSIFLVIASKGLFSTDINCVTTAATSICAEEVLELVELTAIFYLANLLSI